jgi:hypothetical protein
MSVSDTTYRLPTVAGLLLLLLTATGAVALAAGLLLMPARTWVDLFVLANYLVGLGLGALLLVALHYVTGARWSVPIRRVPEAMTALLPAAALGVLAVLILYPSLYSGPGAVVEEVSASPLQRVWLNRPFLLARSVVYLALWLGFARAIVGNSRRQDSDAGSAPTVRNLHLSAGFLVVFGVTCWLASYDWIMSLEPKWASTIFGVYNFASLFLSALAAVALLVIGLRRRESFRALVSADHLHDLGTLLFAFSSFWMYTWFCQYMLIWYVNNPEETAYFRLRWQGVWPFWMLLDVILNWGIPFLVLLFRSAKRNPWLLGAVAVVVLAGRWVDLVLMIFPSQAAAAPVPGLLEGGLLVGTVGIFLLAFFWSLGKASLVPLQEPAPVTSAHASSV